MELIYLNNENRDVYCMSQAAALLGINKVGAMNLYWYLRYYGFLEKDNSIKAEYLKSNYFEYRYGTKNLIHGKLYRKTMITKLGFKKILEHYKEKIAKEHKEYLTELKAKK